MNLQALGNRVIVEALEEKDDVILVPDRSSNNQQRGQVLSVGAGRMLSTGVISTPWVAVGDIVHFNPFGATKIKHQGKEYLILNAEEDLLALEK